MVSNSSSSVQWTSLEVGQLITLIRRENHLYNMDNPDYNIRETVDASWQDISERVGKSVRDCRDKWYNLRTVYRRLLRESQQRLSNAGRAKSNRWVWRDAMAFLLPFLRLNGANSFIGVSDALAAVDERAAAAAAESTEESVAAEGSGGVVKFEVLEVEQDEFSGSTPPPAKRPHLQPTPTVEDSEDDATMFHGDPLSRSWSEQSWHLQPRTRGDADELFLRSLLPDVRALPARQKGIFKLRVQQALYDAMFPAEQP